MCALYQMLIDNCRLYLKSTNNINLKNLQISYCINSNYSNPTLLYIKLIWTHHYNFNFNLKFQI